ncbi:MAG: hypothetical protein MRZ54_10320 [Clostridiales bacterium]|nr:hypothetical protein [Clostridiales bacterium]
MHVSLCVHKAGGAMLAAALLFLDSHSVLAAFLALLLHESAHVLAMWLCGVQECRVELTPLGGVAEAAAFHTLGCWKKLAISAAGVLFSSLSAWLCLVFAPAVPFWKAFYLASVSLALINCLPVWPLDGARALAAVAERMGVEPLLSKAMLYLAYLLSFCLVALGLYGIWLGYLNPTLLLIGPYLAYAAHESALGNTMRQVYMLERTQEKLADMTPLRAYACGKAPERAALLKWLRTIPRQRFDALIVVDEQSGEIEQVLTEAKCAKLLFQEDISSQGLAGQSK